MDILLNLKEESIDMLINQVMTSRKFKFFVVEEMDE